MLMNNSSTPILAVVAYSIASEVEGENVGCATHAAVEEILKDKRIS